MPKTEAREDVDVDAVLAAYGVWLGRQPLAARSREAYLAQVREFVTWLAGSAHGGQALTDPHVRDWAVRDYKRYAKTTKRWAPASVNQALAAIDNFYRSLGIGRPEVAREELAQTAPRALSEAEQRAFLRFVEADPSPRDRAIATVFFYAGLRLSELGALDMIDISVSARRGQVTIREGKGDAYREVPLNSPCRKRSRRVGRGPVRSACRARRGPRRERRDDIGAIRVVAVSLGHPDEHSRDRPCDPSPGR